MNTREKRDRRYENKTNIGFSDEPNTIILRPYMLKELADIYGICTKTLRLLLKPFEKEIGPRKGYYYRIDQVSVIFKKLTPPSFLNIRENQ